MAQKGLTGLRRVVRRRSAGEDDQSIEVAPVEGALVSGVALLALTGAAVLYYPVQSASALVIYERGHVSAGEILRFGFWMTLVAYVAIVCVALPYWAAMGQPLVPGGLN